MSPHGCDVPTASRVTRLSRRRLVAASVALAPVLTTCRPAFAGATSGATPVADAVAGLVDIGGRSLWLECRGQGTPTVILVAGFRDGGASWRADFVQPDSGRTMVMPGVVPFARVCTYDRPGTLLDENTFSRSDPVPQPQTAAAAVSDLHALLEASAVPGPYVLVGHSYGGLVVRLFASTFPAEVCGLVLVDALPALEKWLTCEQWAAYQLLLNQRPTELAGYSDLEMVDVAASVMQLREAAAAAPLHSLPLVVLTRIRPFDLPPDLPPDFSADALERAWAAGQAELAELVPDARHVIADESGHNIHQDQPDLVIKAIRQVVDAVHDPASWAVATPVASQDDTAGRIDIGGRSLYLDARGTGGPTVVLEAGLLSRADVWSRDNRQPEGRRSLVLPAVAGFTRVVAYDRPGTIGVVNSELNPSGPLFLPSRSDPVLQPRTVQGIVEDLHALLRAAAVPGPYVLVGHSVGGLCMRMFASTYPDEVAGLVLVDATHEDVWLGFERALTPTTWDQFEILTIENPELLAAYPEAEQLWVSPLRDDPNVAAMRRARAESPLRPMPLVVLSHGIPFAAPFPGWPAEDMELVMMGLQEDLARLVPGARHVIAQESGHDIHQDQPDLVIEAIRQVVDAVRDPETWATSSAPGMGGLGS